VVTGGTSGIDARSAELVEVPQLELAGGQEDRRGVEAVATRGAGQRIGGGADDLHAANGNRVAVERVLATDREDVLRVQEAGPVGRRQPLLAGHGPAKLDDLEVRSVDVGEDLVVLVGPALEQVEAAAHGRRIGRVRVHEGEAPNRVHVVGVDVVVEVDPDGAVGDVEREPVGVVEEEIDALHVVEVAQGLVLLGRAARVGGALAPAFLLAREDGPVEGPHARRGLDAEQALVSAAVRHVLGPRQREARVPEVEGLDEVVLVPAVVDRDPVRERDRVRRVLEQVDLDAIGELALEPDVEVLLHVERREERAPLAERADLLVRPVALPRERDALRTRHVERRASGPEDALHAPRQHVGKRELEPPPRGGGRHRPEAVDARAVLLLPLAAKVPLGERARVVLERGARRFADGRLAELHGEQHLGRVRVEAHVELAHVVLLGDADLPGPPADFGQGHAHELVLHGEHGGGRPSRRQRVRRGRLGAALEEAPEAGKADQEDERRDTVEGQGVFALRVGPWRARKSAGTVSAQASMVKAFRAKIRRSDLGPMG
jgi:hypothetical protein